MIIWVRLADDSLNQFFVQGSFGPRFLWPRFLWTKVPLAKVPLDQGSFELRFLWTKVPLDQGSFGQGSFGSGSFSQGSSHPESSNSSLFQIDSTAEPCRHSEICLTKNQRFL